MQPDLVDRVSTEADALSAICAGLQETIGRRRYAHWFEGKTALAVCDDLLTIGVGSPFLLGWMQKQYRDVALEVARAVLGPSTQVRFEVDAGVSVARREEVAPAVEESGATAPTGAQQEPAVSPADSPAQLLFDPVVNQPGARPTKTAEASKSPGRGRRFADLADFVSGACNELALTAARHVCQVPGERCNPLYLYGAVGTGKTHLLEGIYRQMRRLHPTLNVVYLTSEAFANYFTQALRDRTLPSFRQRFRSVDVLLMDDIDFLDTTRVIQEEFLHTFTELAGHGRQIVLTADRHPRLLTKLSEELKTRFVSGLVCRIEPPDADTRLQIVKRKAAAMKADFTADALEYVAQRFKNNVRELEGALNCLQAWHAMTGNRVTLATARQVLADLERDCVRIVRMADIEQAVCTLFGVKPKDLKSSSRTRAVSQPRMLAMYLARKHVQAAYSEIGQFFGGRNHSTVMSAERKVQDWAEQRAEVQIASQCWRWDELIDSLEQQLLAG